MDPASIAGLVFTVGGAIQTILSYAIDAKDANQDISSLLTELLAVKGLLEQLELDQQQKQAAFKSREFSDLLQTGFQVIEKLQRDLAPPESRTKKVMRQLKWPLSKDYVQKHIDMLERLKSFCLLVMVRQNSSSEADIKSQVWSIQRLLEQDREERQAQELDMKHQELLRWLAPVNPGAFHATVSQRHHGGTGSWLLKGPLLKLTDSKSDRSTILWLKGKSGSGKTVMISQAVEEIKQLESKDENTALAYFYCTFDNQQSHDPRNILGSLLAQVASKAPSILHEPELGLERNKDTSTEELVAIFSNVLVKYASSFSKVYIVVDAVNESAAILNVASTLVKLASTCGNFRFLFSSTEEFEQANIPRFCEVVLAEMDASAIDADIELYVGDQLARNQSLKRYTTSLKTNIANSVLEFARGNFRYARWQIDNIAAQPTGRDVKRLLRVLPHNLNESYSQLLNRNAVDSPEREYLRRALIWLCFAARPLQLHELAEAVVLDEGDSSLDRDNMLSDPYLLVQISHGIIYYNRDTGVVTLAHLSIRTCLTSEWILSSPISDFAVSETIGHKTILRTCLTYLLFDEFSIGYGAKAAQQLYRPTKYQLMPYVIYQWSFHLRYPDESDVALLLRFLDTRTNGNSGNYGHWLLRILWTQIPPDVVQDTHPLYYAASLGLTSLTKAILKFDPTGLANINSPGGRRGSFPIHVAAYRGYKAVLRVLIEAGADCMAQDPGLGPGGHTNAVNWSKTHGWDDLVALIEEMHPGSTTTALACPLP